jgi:hypothetical protein
MLELVRQHPIQASIVLYFIIVSVILLIQPNMIFNRSGVPRDFGVGDNRRTIYPLWLVCILVAILSFYVVILATL